MKTLLILALVITGCRNPTVVRGGVGPDYTPTPTASKMVITEMGAMKVYVLSGNSYAGPCVLLEVFTTRELAEAGKSKYSSALYLSYTIDEMEVRE